MSGFYHTEYTPEEIKKLLLVGSPKAPVKINLPEEDARARPAAVKDAAMSIDQAERALADVCVKVYLFDGMSQSEVLRIVKNVQFLKFAQKEMVFAQDDISNECYFILSGAIDVFIQNSNGQNVRIGRVSAGNMFGEMAFILNIPRSAACIAAENTTALRFEIKDDGIAESASMLFLQLYINISSSLAKKLKDAGIMLSNTIIP